MNRLSRRLVVSIVTLAFLPLLAFTALHSQPQPITQVAPRSDATGVWLGSSVQVTFAVPMDRNSVESNFLVYPPVIGTFTWQAHSRGESVEFRPDDILAPTTVYSVTLQAGLLNARGQPVLDEAYTWSFTTSQAYDTIEFGQGVPVQLVDPDGRNSVGFWPGYSRIRVDFSLFALETPGFVARYGELVPGHDEPIDITGLIRVATWQQKFGDDTSYAPREATLPDVPSGIYVLVAGHPHAGQDEIYVVVSPYVLAVKRGTGGVERQTAGDSSPHLPIPVLSVPIVPLRGHIRLEGSPSPADSAARSGIGLLIWAVRLQDQTPADGMTVTLYDAQAAAITQGTTDAEGVVELNAAAGEPLMAVGQTSDAVTLSGLDGAWRTGYGYWYWWWDSGSSFDANAYRVYTYTDRPIYRPGHTVHFAAILRHDQDGEYAPVDASQPVTATLRDSRDNVVSTQGLLPDDFGIVNGDFILAAEPPMGTYHIEIEIDGQIHRQEFRVEAYRKPEYQVDVTASVAYAVAGDGVVVAVQADYFFGQPVAGADVVLKVFRWAEYRYPWMPSPGEQIDEFHGTTDSAGRWTTTYTTDGRLDRDADYTFVATVTDASRQPVEGRHVLPVYWNTYRLTLTTDKYGYQLGEPVVAQITAMGHDGTPVAGETVTVTVGYSYPENEIVAQQQVTTDAQGQAQATFNSLPQGWYRITAEARDDRGRRIESRRYVWIYDRSGGWWYSSDDELSITADRESYAPGDTAQLLIESRVTGIALLTLERGAVYEEQVVTLDGPATTVEVQIGEESAPNVFAQVHIFEPGAKAPYYDSSTPEGRLLTAQVELSVSAESHRLALSVTPDTPEYQPGDQATFTIQVTDASGAPVEAVVGLALVDEAIFALSEDLSADIFETFYGPQSNSVLTYDSLSPRRYFWNWLEDGPRGTPTPSPPPPAATPTPPGGRAQDEGQALRQEFRDTAYWNPSIRTGPDGRAEVTVDLPDNLTTWRVIARAVTLDTKVGDASTSILVTQDIIARPALPRFAILGDRFALDTIAQNFSGQDVTGTVSLDAPSLVVLDPGLRTVDLPNMGTDVAHWTAVASEVGVGTITCALDTPAGSDAVELPLPTEPFAVPERWSAAGQADPVALEHFDIPFNAVHEASELTLRLSPSVALGVLDGLDALIDYPYGCVEQTMSRVLPSAVAARAYQELGIPNPKAEELPDIIHQGVQRLYGFQHEDGGWGWWYDDEGSVYMTAYVLFGLTMVQQASFKVEPSVLDRGFVYLDARLRTVNDSRIMAYALYVKSVAGRGDLAAAQALLPDQASLDPFARAALALTLDAEGDPEAAEMLVDYLISEAVETPTTAHWPPKDSTGTRYHWRTMSSAEKNTAMALRALVALRSDHRFLPKVVRWLMDHRRGAGWRDTQATAFAILGLTDYIQISGELEADYTYTVTLNGEEIASGQVTPETVTEPIDPIVVPGTDLHGKENELRIERDGPGQLYYTLVLRLELFYDSFEPVSSVDQGLAVHRTYRLADGDRREDPDWGQSTSQDTFNIGDLVEVQLTLEALDEVWYVVIEDPLPSGFEALNERMNPLVYGDTFAPWRWHEWGYNRKDVYDDKVTFFMTQLWPGRRVITYLMRATTPGEFSALPAQAYPMYDEEVWGRSASQQLHVSVAGLTPRPDLTGDFNRDCRLTRFDTVQVVGAWKTNNAVRDVDGDGDVDIVDVVTVANRQGATCLTDRPAPGVGEGRVTLSAVPAVESITVGQAFDVNVSLDEGEDPAGLSPLGQSLGGFGLTLAFDSARLRVSRVVWAPALDGATYLGPRIDNEAGQVSFGAFGIPSGMAHGRLVAVTFISQRAGQAEFEVRSVQSVDSQGRTVEASATVGHQVTIKGTTWFIPLVLR